MAAVDATKNETGDQPKSSTPPVGLRLVEEATRFVVVVLFLLTLTIASLCLGTLDSVPEKYSRFISEDEHTVPATYNPPKLDPPTTPGLVSQTKALEIWTISFSCIAIAVQGALAFIRILKCSQGRLHGLLLMEVATIVTLSLGCVATSTVAAKLAADWTTWLNYFDTLSHINQTSPGDSVLAVRNITITIATLSSVCLLLLGFEGIITGKRTCKQKPKDEADEPQANNLKILFSG